MSTIALTADVERARNRALVATAVMAGLLALAPWLGLYPVFVMKVLCYSFSFTFLRN